MGIKQSESIFAELYNSKKAKEYYKRANLFEKKDFNNIIKISELEKEIKDKDFMISEQGEYIKQLQERIKNYRHERSMEQCRKINEAFK